MRKSVDIMNKGDGMKKIILSAITAGFLLVGLFVTPASADSRCNGKLGITLYEDIRYGGSSITFCSALLPTGGPHLSKLSPWGWNDKTSSYQFFNATANDCIRLYEHENFRGATLTTCGSEFVSDLTVYYPGRSDGFNDTISSLRVLDY